MVKKILIVDDNKEDLANMKNILENAKYDVIATTSEKSALGYSKKQKFDLILLDIQMPHLSGYELLKLIKADKKGKPYVMFVSIVPYKEVDLSGADGFIQKPFGEKTFLAGVKDILKKR
jgi:CheY-like chemotaxis protein